MTVLLPFDVLILAFPLSIPWQKYMFYAKYPHKGSAGTALVLMGKFEWWTKYLDKK